MINTSGTLGYAIAAFTTNYTGSLTITLFSILILLFVIGIGLRMPIELIIPLLIPIVIVFMIYDANFRIIGGIMLLILAAIGVRNWLF